MSRTGITTGERCIEVVIEKVVDREGTEWTDLPPLADVLDPDALAALVDSADGGTVIEFAYCGYRVAVEGDGTVAVREIE